MRRIDLQDSDCGSALGSAANEDGAMPTEMPLPFLAPRIEQPGALAGLRINSGEIRTYMMIVSEASQCQIAGSGLTAVLFRDDMIDFERY
jgi:hypothetical protein